MDANDQETDSAGSSSAVADDTLHFKITNGDDSAMYGSSLTPVQSQASVQQPTAKSRRQPKRSKQTGDEDPDWGATSGSATRSKRKRPRRNDWYVHVVHVHAMYMHDMQFAAW